TGSPARRGTSTSRRAWRPSRDDQRACSLRRTRFDRAPCPIARATDLVGDWWTPIILRNVILGQRRFDQLTESLGGPRAILSRRLNRPGVEARLWRRPHHERPPL